MEILSKKMFLTISVISLLMFGCADQKIGALEGKIKKLEERVKAFEPGRWVLEEPPGTNVTTEENTYSLLNTDFGVFPIKVDDLKPYLDGYKVRLAIGNPTTILFSGVKINAWWGPALQKRDIFDEVAAESKKGKSPVQADPEGQGLSKKKTFEITNSFPPGRYTSFEITLSPAKPEEIKNINVEAIFNKISLLNVKK